MPSRELAAPCAQVPGPIDAWARPFGQLLRAHRTAAQMSQQALAEASGTSARLISNLERGVAGVPRPGTLTALADAFGLAGSARAQFLNRRPGRDLPAGRLPFGGLLRSMRERAGLTQDDLAARALVSPRTVSDLERGISRAPRRDTAALMAHTLGLTGSDLGDFDAAVASAAEFVRLRSGRTAVDEGPGVVPTPATALVGRGEELAMLYAALADGAVRTIVGTAGVGKTRLAVEFARTLRPEAAPRVLFAPLASTRTVADVLVILARTLDVLLEETGDKDGGYEDAALGVLADALRSPRTVLVLDNLEQVERADHLVATLAARAPGCLIVATSRTALGVDGERTVALAPLPVPEPDVTGPGDLLGSPAVRLFLDRGLAAAPRWQPERELADVASLCRMLDGLPLALVLAAPAVRTGPVQAIAADIMRRPRSRGPARQLPHRHRSLHASLAWSYRLLDQPSRLLFARLAVFRSAVDVETVELVCGTDGLDVTVTLHALVAANLVIAVEDRPGEATVRMLNAVAQFATERLEESGEAEVFRRRLAQIMVGVAETAAPKLVGADQGVWQAQLTRRIDILRGCFDWLLATAEPALLARLAAALWRFWYLGGHLGEGRERTAGALRALEDAPGVGDAVADIRYGLGVLSYMSGEVAGARQLWLRSLADYEGMSRLDGVANSQNNLGMSYLYAGDLTAARTHYEEALAAAERSGSVRAVAVTLGNVAKLLVEEGRPEQAPSVVTQALDLFRTLGDVRAEADLYALLAEVANASGDTDEARARWLQALDGFEQLADPTGIGPILVLLAELDATFDDQRSARDRIDRALQISADCDDPWTTAHACVVDAQLRIGEGDRARAVEVLDRADTLSAECDHVEVRARVLRLREQLARS